MCLGVGAKIAPMPFLSIKAEMTHLFSFPFKKCIMQDFEIFVECIDNAGVIIAKMKDPVHTSSDEYAKNKILSWIDSSLRGVHQGKTNRLLISFNVPEKGLSLPLNMVNDVY